MIVYKNILGKLKDKGYTVYRLRKEHILSESVIQKLRDNDYVSLSTVNTICNLLECKISDILEYKDGR